MASIWVFLLAARFKQVAPQCQAYEGSTKGIKIMEFQWSMVSIARCQFQSDDATIPNYYFLLFHST